MALHQGKNPHYPMDRRMGGSRTTLDVVAKKENPFPCQELKPGHPLHSLVTILTKLLQLHQLKLTSHK
jgi:hypothetical protein